MGKYVVFTPHPESLDGINAPSKEKLVRLGFSDVNTALANTIQALENRHAPKHHQQGSQQDGRSSGKKKRMKYERKWWALNVRLCKRQIFMQTMCKLSQTKIPISKCNSSKANKDYLGCYRSGSPGHIGNWKQYGFDKLISTNIPAANNNKLLIVYLYTKNKNNFILLIYTKNKSYL